MSQAAVDHITWQNWGSITATGHGTLESNNCTPNCANGTYTPSPAALTAGTPVPYGTRYAAYSDLSVQSPGLTQPVNFPTNMAP